MSCWDEAQETLHIVQLSTDALADPFDLNISPSHAESSGAVLASSGAGASPGEQRLREQIQLPKMGWFKLQGVYDDEDLGEEEKKMALLQIYQDSVLDLLSGLELTLMAGNQEYVDSHCQLMPGFTSLKVDYGCDNCIAEFPLKNVTKMYRVVKRRANHLHLAEHHPRTSYPFPETEHIVIVEFVSRKLVFVFTNEVEAQRFLLCFEFLTWQSQHDERPFDGYRERIIPLFDGELSGW